MLAANSMAILVVFGWTLGELQPAPQLSCPTTALVMPHSLSFLIIY